MHTRPLGLLVLVAALCGGGVVAVGASAPAAAAGSESRQVAVAADPATGQWQSHRYRFAYLSSNTTYACEGLASKLKILLKTLGAHDLHVQPVCFGHPGVPENVPEATLKFQSLKPVGAEPSAAEQSPGGTGATAPGVWRHVAWAPQQPNGPQGLGSGDCSLVQQVVEHVVPMFATRNLQTKYDCAQYHDYGSFSVSFDVFVPADNR
jgi:hypothetical protein